MIQVKHLIFFIAAVTNILNAQSNITITGRIIDESNKNPLDLTTVYVPETKYYAESNTDGAFRLELPFKDVYLIKISRLGYEKKEQILRIAPEQTNYQINIALKQIINQEVVIKESVINGNSNIREKVKSFELLPTVSGNIESVLPSIALGVRSSAGGELSSQYSVRGGSYDENLVFINDFEIYRPQLIRNGQQEGLSFPNADLIRELNFSSGGFEAKYGDKQSSVLDIKYKIPDSIHASIAASALGFTSHIEGSNQLRKNTKNKLRYLIGARYKTSKYLLNSLDVKGEYQPVFFDLQSFVTYDINSKLQLAWISNWNRSQFNLIPESSSVAKGSAFLTLKLNTYFEGSEVDAFDQKMSGISLTYFPYRKHNPYFIKYISSVNKASEAEQFDILGYYRLTEIETGGKDQDGKEVKLWGEGSQHLYARNYLSSWIHQHELRSGIDFTPRENSKIDHFMQYGISAKYENYNDRLNEWERIDSSGYSLPYDGQTLRLNNVYKSKNNILNDKYAAFIQDEIQWIASSNLVFKITPGIRFHYATLNGESILNPRIKIELQPQRRELNQHYWISGGLYYQPPIYREMRRLDGNINTDLLSQKSIHAVIGLKRDFHWKKIAPTPFRWISELYYKNLWDVVSYELDNVRIRYAGDNNSTAYAIGWDNRINGEFASGAESWVNLSILRTREKLNNVQHLQRVRNAAESKSITDVPRPTDQFFALGLFFQDYLPNNKNCKMHMNTTIASGLPYGFKGDNIIYRNAYRFKPYHRVDIGFSYQLWDNKLKVDKPRHFLRFAKSAWISAEVFNLLKIKNEASVSWIKSVYNYQFAIPNYLSSRRINLKIRVDF